MGRKSSRDPDSAESSPTLPALKTPIPGPRSLEIFAAERAYLGPSRQKITLLAQIAFENGHGATLTDADGNVYLDFVAGIGVASLGHGRKDLARALSAQAERLIVGSFANRTRLRALQRLSELLPSYLGAISLFSGGAEAVEAALRVARSYTGKHEVVGFWGAFHGKTGAVLGLAGDGSKKGYGPFSSGQYVIPYADCYRCAFRMSYPSCGLYCVEFARRYIDQVSAGAVSAILVEPCQATTGNVVPPDDYLPALKKVAREKGALLIVDEMITGAGRTGRMWAIEHSGVEPDVMTIGKGIGGGFPVSATVCRPELVERGPFSLPGSASSSYGGNPLAAAALEHTLRVIVEERLVENAREVGAILLNGLRELMEEFPFIGDVRGRGLLIGIDFVRNRKTKEPLGQKTMHFIFSEALKRGLLTMGYSARMRINPPLVLSAEQAQAGLAILRDVFKLVERSISWRTEN